VAFRQLILVALLGATVCLVSDVGAGARASGRASCGTATPLKGAPILQLGSVRVAGFASERCAWVRLNCGPTPGGLQAALAVELSEPPKSPIVLRATGSNAVRLKLVGSTTPAPKVPRCWPARGTRAQVTLAAPKEFFVLFVFAPKNVSFQLTAWRGSRRLGTAVIACRA
jgi:hypothetical protein